ncbi:hypothetical protein M8J76_013671 [Diaphorina citri]|nr:hypothetical protein M8J76_013671 [Diaphorina citri]
MSCSQQIGRDGVPWETPHEEGNRGPEGGRWRIGFSDPYCMLGIQPSNTASPQASSPGSPSIPASSGHRQGPSSRALSEGGLDPEESKREHHEKLRKHHSFRLSFKRKDRRETHRDSISSAVPAKFIRATSVRPQTLNPRWNEKFRL